MILARHSSSNIQYISKGPVPITVIYKNDNREWPSKPEFIINYARTHRQTDICVCTTQTTPNPNTHWTVLAHIWSRRTSIEIKLLGITRTKWLVFYILFFSPTSLNIINATHTQTKLEVFSTQNGSVNGHTKRLSYLLIYSFFHSATKLMNSNLFSLDTFDAFRRHWIAIYIQID